MVWAKGKLFDQRFYLQVADSNCSSWVFLVTRTLLVSTARATPGTPIAVKKIRRLRIFEGLVSSGARVAPPGGMPTGESPQYL